MPKTTADEDARARVARPDRDVNLAQLTAELGVELVASEDEILEAHPGKISAVALAAAVQAHRADPLYGLEGTERRLAELEAKADTLTPAEQKEAVGLLLRDRRGRRP